jgi:probable HAF family extracellular repeat protein
MNAKTVTLTFLALVSGAAEPALSQSTGLPQTNPPPIVSDALRLLTRPLSQSAVSARAKSVVPDAVALGLARARVYRYASADFPGAATSWVLDENKSTIVGYFDYVASSSPSGFTFKGGVYQAFTVPGSLPANLTTGINMGGEIVGIYADFGDVQHGFLDKAGVFTNVDESSGTTVPYDINDAGTIVGVHQASGTTHGFSTADGGASFTDFDVPTATETTAAGINSAGAIVGQWVDSAGKSHGFLLSGGVYTSLDFPLATSTAAFGINDSNEIAGFFIDAGNVTHGFIYSAGVYTMVDVAGATGTELTRIKNDGHVTGVYADSSNEVHGLTGQ